MYFEEQGRQTQALIKLFELLDAFSSVSIGKLFGIDWLCKHKQELIKAMVHRSDATTIFKTM
jgi:hypothetical protein